MTPQFKSRVETFGPRFKADLGLTHLQVCGMFGNFAVESDQFRALQEYKPTVKGSRGGFGWPQWTGPRRRAYEAWCAAGGLKPADDASIYAYILVELYGSEKAALAALKRTKTLDTATETFMRRFERPGVPHLDKRKAYALEALHVLEAAIGVESGPPAPAAKNRLREAAPLVSAVALPPSRAATVVPEGTKPSLLGLAWAKLTGRTTTPNVPVIAGSVGDPTIFYVQKVLREKAYYTKGFLDGRDGGLTQGAVAQIRKDNGMGDGGIDADFLTRLPSFPQRPVSQARATISVAAAADHAPELFSPPSWLWKAGLGVIGLGGADSAQQQGLLDGVKGGIDKANDVFGTVQSAFSALAGIVGFVVEHRVAFLMLIGALLVWKGVSSVLTAWIKVRQAFF